MLSPLTPQNPIYPVYSCAYLERGIQYIIPLDERLACEAPRFLRFPLSALLLRRSPDITETIWLFCFIGQLYLKTFAELSSFWLPKRSSSREGAQKTTFSGEFSWSHKPARTIKESMTVIKTIVIQ
ncbi:hypothetical protein CDAR_518171 [Caerostris darwini]|uniref:Uncharacterized protein n=1 Tax=Caerostris darwini TaxID=1538125 RepID=A0AAV4RPM4_9ARAC|nr:hypothetical protein CDAR_518171 [Caerostris darwini]